MEPRQQRKPVRHVLGRVPARERSGSLVVPRVRAADAKRFEPHGEHLCGHLLRARAVRWRHHATDGESVPALETLNARQALDQQGSALVRRQRTGKLAAQVIVPVHDQRQERAVAAEQPHGRGGRVPAVERDRRERQMEAVAPGVLDHRLVVDVSVRHRVQVRVVEQERRPQRRALPLGRGGSPDEVDERQQRQERVRRKPLPQGSALGELFEADRDPLGRPRHGSRPGGRPGWRAPRRPGADHPAARRRRVEGRPRARTGARR